MAPHLSVPAVDVRIDYENVHIGLERQGQMTDPRLVVRAIRSAVADLGQIVSLTAYADWRLLRTLPGCDVPYELAAQGVEPVYLVNVRGKNTCDMRLANDVRDLLESRLGSPADVDVIVLVSGDRDFRDTIRACQRRRKQVVVLAPTQGFSRELANLGCEVRYLQDYMPRETRAERVTSDLPDARSASLIMVIHAFLIRSGRRWASLSEISRAVAPSGLGEVEVRRAVNAGWLVRQQLEAGPEPAVVFGLNHAHARVRAVVWVARWLPARIQQCLQQRGMPWVDSGYLARGMQMDRELQQMGLGQTRQDAEAWLDRAEAAGLILRVERPHPDTPSHIINTWRLPSARPAADLVACADQRAA